ncbi:ParB/RepB/Spo0J family partition protein [Pelagimonas varians]|uniref:ParB-like nuclease domain protein n=1 Tax=Pelagimonas varians TaxID=696760 RepID=A0A238L6U8_9RHOB|nr:ParB/RepB/Spo0J family partition protein [Pelagimonas varians]PYG24700.1 ParB-like nuclease family protein [Pelagimonas varians]SMX50718.1 ParB-like nuclease domain protein [Pelagimonas varians]
MKKSQGVQLQGVHSAQVELHEIEERPEVFQLREGLQEYHVKELMAVLKRGLALDPVKLWKEPETGALVLVDGHHRLAAYRKAKWTKRVPAQIYRCDRKAARLLAMGENGKTRLPLTSTERSNAAWSLVCDGPEDAWTYSKKEIVDASGAGEGTVAKMRRIRKALLKDDPKATLDTNWGAAQQALKGQHHEEYTDEMREAWVETQTNELNDKIGSVLGFYAAKYPEAAANVILKRCHHECRQQIHADLRNEFNPYDLEDEGDY